jgi:fructoselysine 6-kinase
MTLRKPLVACIGDNRVDRYVGTAMSELVGGHAVNVAVRLSHAGMQSAYVGVVGDDAEGGRIRAALEAEGVDAEHVAVAGGRSTGVSVTRAEGESRYLVSDEAGAAADVRVDGDLLPFLLDCTWVHGARLSQRDGKAMALLAQHGVSVSYDFLGEWTEALLASYCPHLEAAFFSGSGMDDEEAAHHVQRMVALGARCAVVTRGRAGVVAWAEGRLLRRPVRPAAIVDTLGAGDAFIAGFITATLAGAGADEALDRAGNEAAECCTFRGAWRPRGARIFG